MIFYFLIFLLVFNNGLDSINQKVHVGFSEENSKGNKPMVFFGPRLFPEFRHIKLMFLKSPTTQLIIEKLIVLNNQ